MTSTSLLDLLLVSAHVPAGAIAAAFGAGAMLAPKGGRSHIRRGRVYLVALLVVCATGVGLVATRGPRFLHLAPFGFVAAALALAGYSLRHRQNAAAHLVCMGLSYIAMLTAFYVDNGPKLPVWRTLPPVLLWTLPALIGIPLIALGLRRHARRLRSHERPTG